MTDASHHKSQRRFGCAEDVHGGGRVISRGNRRNGRQFLRAHSVRKHNNQTRSAIKAEPGGCHATRACMVSPLRDSCSCSPQSSKLRQMQGPK